MAATAKNTNPSPPSSVVAAAANANSSLSPRSPSLTRTESPPWTQIVRGQDSESTAAPISPPLESSLDDNNNNYNNPQENFENAGGGGKKVAWNKKPTNGSSDNGGPGPVVMGPAEAWPALSESTSKASPKLDSSSKNLPDFGSLSSPQVTGTESSSSSLSIASSVQSQSQSSTYQKPATSNLNHNHMPNHGRPARQRSMKRDGGGNSQANGGFTHQPSSSIEGSHNNNHSSMKPAGGGGSDGSGRDNIQNHGHREPGSRNASGDHHQSRNSFRRGSGGSHSREGSHQNYGGRRGDQDRGNHEWNHQRSFNGRDATMQPRVSPRGFRPPSAASAPFVHPAPMRPTFMNPMGVADVPVFYLHGVPFVTPVPGPVFIHAAQDPQLNAKIVNQIDYYFSYENLIRDTYLRQNMDENGWVPVTLIANFKKVMQLTENIQLILDAVRSSTVVEVQGDKIRKRDDWVRWIMPPVPFPIASGSQSPKSPTIDALSAHIQNVKVDEINIDQNYSKGHLDNLAAVSRSISGDLNISSEVVTGVASSSGC